MRNRILILLLIIAISPSCRNEQKPLSTHSKKLLVNNLLSDVTSSELGDFKWLNEPKSYTINNGSLNVIAEKGTDFFNNPEDSTITSTAPFLYQNISGDFVAQALVRADFSSVWNAASIMVYIDEHNWIKFAFENSDATGKSIVSVVTRQVSDDANGVVLSDEDEVWLKLVRKGNNYAMFWSIDGEDFKMARLAAMPPVDSLKIGVEAQCPVGESATHQILYFGLVKKTVEDLRKGV
ncbi:MAG: DUF1349 domain-containing protein [Eudoraea sp.]|nr:DUF1349 domain-containing protein [Eudoraea sp.]